MAEVSAAYSQLSLNAQILTDSAKRLSGCHNSTIRGMLSSQISAFVLISAHCALAIKVHLTDFSASSKRLRNNLMIIKQSKNADKHNLQPSLSQEQLSMVSEKPSVLNIYMDRPQLSGSLSQKSPQVTSTCHPLAASLTKTEYAMKRRSVCPCCSSILLRHIGLKGLYWRCSYCEQEMPVL
jgi:hypothetical protein